MPIVVVTNTKGGVAKTTTTAETAANLARRGRRVLLLDMDPAGCASWALGCAPAPRQPCLGEAVLGRTPLEDVIRETYLPNLWVAPASRELAKVTDSTPLGSLTEALDPVRDRYDLILVDSPPTLSPVFVLALLTADEALFVTSADPHGERGLAEYTKEWRALGGKYSSMLPNRIGVLLTKWDTRSNVSREVGRRIRGALGEAVFQTFIRRDATAERAPDYAKAIADLDPECRAARDYDAAVDELIRRLHLRGYEV